MEGKVARSVGILYKLIQTLPQTVMLQLYYALVFSTFVSIVWYNYVGSHESYLFTEIKILTK